MIDQEKFSQEVEAYLDDPGSFSEERVESALSVAFEKPASYFHEGKTVTFTNRGKKGIRFGYTAKLVMQLLGRGYDSLAEWQTPRDYAQAVAGAMQSFAEPFPEEDTLCYPHFLLHGIALPRLEDIVQKVKSNSRIIHETLGSRQEIMKRYGIIAVDGGLNLMMAPGCTDDYFGIALLLAREDAVLVSSAANYVAKSSFFTDNTNRDIYVITVQSCRFSDLSESASENDRIIDGEREYGRIGNVLGRSPRGFVLAKLKEFSKQGDFRSIKVVRPDEHPMSVEEHEGFFGGYENVIRKAGIGEESRFYLESRL